MSFKAVLAAATLLVVSTAAHATTIYVGKGGSDVAGCGMTALGSPCLTIQYGFNAAVAGGGFARVIISSSGIFTESVTVAASGSIEAANDVIAILSTVTAGSTTLTINGSGDLVFRLYNFQFGGGGTGGTGLLVNHGSRIQLDKMRIRGYSTYGINFAPASGGSTVSTLAVKDSEISEHSSDCFVVQPVGTQSASVNVTNSEIHHCSKLGYRTSSANTTGNALSWLDNVRVYSTTAAAVSAVSVVSSDRAANHIVSSTIGRGGTGVVANGPKSTNELNRSQVINNTTGLSVANGGINYSSGNNLIGFNSSNGPAVTLIGEQ